MGIKKQAPPHTKFISQSSWSTARQVSTATWSAPLPAWGLPVQDRSTLVLPNMRSPVGLAPHLPHDEHSLNIDLSNRNPWFLSFYLSLQANLYFSVVRLPWGCRLVNKRSGHPHSSRSFCLPSAFLRAGQETQEWRNSCLLLSFCSIPHSSRVAGFHVFQKKRE